MRLTLRKEEDKDWYCIEKAEHDGTEDAGRLVDGDIEGQLFEMVWIAEAIETRTSARFKRCAVIVHKDLAGFGRPKTNGLFHFVDLEEADELASQIRREQWRRRYALSAKTRDPVEAKLRDAVEKAALTRDEIRRQASEEVRSLRLEIIGANDHDDPPVSEDAIATFNAAAFPIRKKAREASQALYRSVKRLHAHLEKKR